MPRKASKSAAALARLIVPGGRVTALNDRPARERAGYVLYWMTAFRRTRFNFALQRAVEWAVRLGKPLVVLDALRVDYPWASDRFHRFVLDGMADLADAFAEAGVLHHRYVEPAPGRGKGLLAALAADACVVVSDDSPAFFLPRARAAAARQVDVLLEAVDSNGLVPLAAPGRAFVTAYAFRRWLQRALPEHLARAALADPFEGVELPRLRALPKGLLRRWPAAPDAVLAGDVSSLPIDHSVPPVALRGGQTAARERLEAFVSGALARYDEDRSHPDREGVSGLSPYLHFGHLSPHEVLAEITRAHPDWSPEALRSKGGKREGYWQLPASSEAFLDQLVTWRELGFGFAHHRGNAGDVRSDPLGYASLPAWARATLEKHAADPRPHLYTLEQLEQARTHDPLWNAAQRQLLREGTIHGALRMLWGKKVLEWSPDPRRALEVLFALNDRWALDGRDPNSASGIFWTLGRYDRPWGPERPIFGTVRYMSAASAARKWRLRSYLARYAE